MKAAEFKLGDLGSAGGVGLRAVYLCGPPGIGKTHQIIAQESSWRRQGIEPIRVRPSNVRDLIDHFAAADGRSPIVMEEADIIFRSKPMFEVLKQATDPLTPDYLYRMEVIDKEKVQVAVNLNVPIIVSTNMDLTSDEGWDKDHSPRADGWCDDRVLQSRRRFIPRFESVGLDFDALRYDTLVLHARELACRLADFCDFSRC